MPPAPPTKVQFGGGRRLLLVLGGVLAALALASWIGNRGNGGKSFRDWISSTSAASTAVGNAEGDLETAIATGNTTEMPLAAERFANASGVFRQSLLDAGPPPSHADDAQALEDALAEVATRMHALGACASPATCDTAADAAKPALIALNAALDRMNADLRS